MPKLYNLARMTSATTGAGTITLGVAVAGYLTFANAGVANGDVVFYGIKDGSNSEAGWGTYTSSGTTLTRNVIKSTNGNALISCSGSEEVYITALASDGGDLLPGFDHPMRGFDTPLNLQLNASVASNILTVALKGNNGSDPSNSNPVLIPFRDPTAANGGPIWRAVTAANSISTVVGAHLGASSANQPFRLWVLAFDNAGGIGLALWQSVTGGASPIAIASLNEAAPASTTAMSASATSAGVFYTAAGVALTGKAFRILGYLDFASGQATPGSYATAPSTIQLFGPGIPKPGMPTGVYAQSLTTTPTNTVSNTWTSTNVTASLTLTAAMNAVKFSFAATGVCGVAGALNMAAMFRGSTLVGPVTEMCADSATTAAPRHTISADWLDMPGATSVTYTLKINGNQSSSSLPAVDTLSGNHATASATFTEIMV